MEDEQQRTLVMLKDENDLKDASVVVPLAIVEVLYHSPSRIAFPEYSRDGNCWIVKSEIRFPCQCHEKNP
jgi:hypothetical protein